jgi:hypothetical protein
MGSVASSIGKVAGAVMGGGLAGIPGIIAGSGIGGALGGGAERALGLGGDAPNQGALAELQGQGINMAAENAADFAKQQENRQAFANQLADQAAGKGPSLAQAQLQAAQDRGLAQQVAAAKANRAQNPALAARQSAQLGAQMQAQTAQNAGIARMQEMQAAQQAYQNNLNSTQNARSSAISSGTGAASAGAANIGAHEKSQKDMFGNILKTAGSMFGLGMAHGGMVPQGYAGGGLIDIQGVQAPTDYKYYANMFAQPESKSESFLPNMKRAPAETGFKALAGGPMDAGGVPVSPLEQLQQIERGGVPLEMVAANGAMVPGEAPVEGDNAVNDIVPAKLSPGEMVVPRSVVDAGPKEIKNFAEALLKHKSVKQDAPKSFGAVLAAKAHMQQQLAEIESKYNKKA